MPRHLRPIDAEDPPGGSGTGGGNGGLTRHRLSELERRMGTLEGKVDDLAVTCAEIKTKLDEIASKSYVLWIFGGTAAALVLSLVGHLLIRALGAG